MTDVERAQERWGLRVGDPAPGGYLSDVYFCEDSTGRELVLKLCGPQMKPEQEAAALELWAGDGAPSLVGFDRDLSALLIERVRPGSPFPEGSNEPLPAIADLLTRMHRPVDAINRQSFDSFPTAFESYLDRTESEAEPDALGLRLLERATDSARRLAASTPYEVLLHGDFLDKNVLRSTVGWVAIDPMPRIGDPCADIGFFAAAHPPASDISSRARKLAELMGQDPDRAERWAAVWAVGQGCETWRSDSMDLQAWLMSDELDDLLRSG